jgi:hypothetical protein
LTLAEMHAGVGVVQYGPIDAKSGGKSLKELGNLHAHNRVA